MKLIEAKLYQNYIVKSNIISDIKTRFRLLDMGLYSGANICVLDRRKGKKNILVAFNGVKYMLTSEIANMIEVENA